MGGTKEVCWTEVAEQTPEAFKVSEQDEETAKIDEHAQAQEAAREYLVCNTCSLLRGILILETVEKLLAKRARKTKSLLPASAMPPPTKGTHAVALGESLRGRGRSSELVSMRYTFKPTSADWSRPGKLRLSGRAAELEVASLESSAPATLFSGTCDEAKETECLLLCDSSGQWRIERIHKHIKNLRPQREGDGNAAARRRGAVGGAARGGSAGGSAGGAVGASTAALPAPSISVQSHPTAADDGV